MERGYRIGESAGKGRCLVATKAFPAGAAVLICEPYEAALLTQEAATRSHVTFSSSEELLRCSGCKFARYASREEQAQAWKHGHKEECKALQRCAPDVPPHTARLLARILWRRLRGGSSLLEQGGSYREVEGLVDHWEELEPDRKAHYMGFAAKTLKFMDPAGEMVGLPGIEETARIYARLAFNSRMIISDTGSPVAIGLYPLAAMINHSCTPNTVQIWSESRKLKLCSTRAIGEGEEITMSYTRLDKTRPERRGRLLQGYLFDIDEGAAPADEAEPLATLWEIGGQLPIEIRIWHQPPWPLDERDAELMGLAASPGAGTHTAGSGVMAAIQSAAGKSGLFHATEEQGHDMSGWPFDGNPSGSDAAAGSSEELGHEEGVRRQRRLVVDCWGPAFLKGTGIWESEVRQLARHLLGLCIILAPTGDKQQALTFDCDASGLFKLGKLHILRCRLLQMMPRWLETTGSRATLDSLLALREFHAVAFPQACPELAVQEAFIARLASDLGMHGLAQEAAARALPQLRMFMPNSWTIYDMMRLMSNG